MQGRIDWPVKRKIESLIVDLLLITLVFAVTDSVMLHVLHSENLWLELGIYIFLYGIVFGTKSGIVYLWKKAKQEKQ
jgi:hypothetical protein